METLFPCNSFTSTARTAPRACVCPKSCIVMFSSWDFSDAASITHGSVNLQLCAESALTAGGTCLTSHLILSPFCTPSRHARTHARTHTRTHARNQDWRDNTDEVERAQGLTRINCEYQREIKLVARTWTKPCRSPRRCRHAFSVRHTRSKNILITKKTAKVCKQPESLLALAF